MIYPDKIEEKIGFAAIRSQLSKKCHCEGARQFCSEMSFQTDFETVKAALLAVDEMQRANHSDETLPLEGVDDIDRDLAVIKIPGTFLEVKDLLKVRRMLECFSRIASYFRRHNEDGHTPYPQLSRLSVPLDYIPSTLGFQPAPQRHCL